MEFEDKIIEICNKRVTGTIEYVSYYKSEMEGLGSQYSDIDVYVIYDGDLSTDSIIRRKLCYVEMITVEKMDFDIEYYSLDEFNEQIDKVQSYSLDSKKHNVFEINLEISKFVHKLYLSREILRNPNFSIINQEINIKNNLMIARTYLDLYRGDMEDAIKFYKEKRFLEAYYMLQKSFINLSFSIFGKYNLPTTKGKWFIKRIDQVSKYDNGFLKEVLENFYLRRLEDIDFRLVKEFIQVLRRLSLEVL